MSSAGSYRSIVRSTGIIAGAQMGVLLIGLVRAKLFAIWVGPAGIGLLGILNSLLANAALVAGMGLGTSGVRQMATPDDDIAVVRRAILWLGVLLGCLGGAMVWLFRTFLSISVTGTAQLAPEIGFVGIAVALTVFASSLTAILQGLRRLGDLALMQLGGTLLGVIAGVAAVAALGSEGIIVAVIAAPAGLVIAGVLLARRNSTPLQAPIDRERLVRVWKPVLKVGVVIMGTAVIAGLTQTLLRAILLRELGLDQLGLFQAATAILTMNVSLVLTAMAADYFPRLSQVAADDPASERLLNEQLHVALLASLPILTMLSALPSLWLWLLYSDRFSGAADMMRWLALAECLRLPIWALGYLLLARRDTASYVLSETSISATTLVAALLLVHGVGLVGVAMAVVLGLAVGVLVTGAIVWKKYGMRLHRECLLPLTALTLWLLLLAVTAPIAPTPTAIAGVAVSIVAAVYVVQILRSKGAFPAKLEQLLAKFRPARRQAR